MERVELTDNKKIIFDDIEFTQVRLLVDIQEYKAGDLGGWVESIDNLKNPETGDIEGAVLGNACIYNNAKVFNNAVVRDRAVVFEDAWVFGDAVVENKVRVYSNGIVKDNARVGSRCKVVKGGVVANDTHIYSCITIKDETVTKAPFQMFGSRKDFPIALRQDVLSIGCETHSLTYWEANLERIGEEGNYGEEGTNEYLGYLKEARKLFGT